MSLRAKLNRLRYRLYRFYYRAKYFPFAAERRTRRERDERGFVVIQLDALAHEDVVRAIERGYAPNLRRLIEREGWELRRFPAGLPSATPAAQAAIFFGTKERIPAFRYYEKRDRRVIVGSKPADVQYIRDRLPQDGVLRGGSSYVNIYDGGAAQATFTLSEHEPQPLLVKMGGRRVLLLAALHPFRMTRMLLASVWEYLREEWHRLVSQFKGQYTYYWWYLPFLHIGSNLLLRELQTIATLLDIYTGSPAIYTTYNVYDEYAHHFGPESRAAYSGIRAMDRRVGEIIRMLRRAPGRPYDLYILSDHGQTPSVPYRVKYGETIGETVVAAAKHGVLVMASTGDYTVAPHEVMDFLVSELEEVSGAGSLPTKRLGGRLGRWLRRQYKLFPLVAENVKVSDEGELIVTYSSSLAHLYWTLPDEPLAFEHIRSDPAKRALYYFLVAHGGIGVVITRMLDGAHVESLRGRAIVSPDGAVEVISGIDPLEHYATTNIERRAIAELAQWPNSGDIVLFGAYDPQLDLCVCFDDQVGAHGALGGRQGWPFIMTPRGLIPADYDIDDPLDLYPILRRYTEPVDDPRLELRPVELRFGERREKERA